MPDTPDEQPETTPVSNLRIWQQNINKSLEGQSDLLVSLKMDYDVCLIQEPYIDFKGKTRANPHWSVIYPETHNTNHKATRSLILVNTRLKSDSWTHIPFDSPDVTGIQLVGDFGTLRLINIYNDCNHNDSLTHLSNYLRNPQNRIYPQAPLHNMWMGDFNRHHSLWDEPRNEHLFTQRNLDLTQPLLDLIGRYSMKMALPPGIPTLKAFGTGNHTRVDNVFCSENTLDNITQCDAGETRPQKTDHYPIITTLDIGPPVLEFIPRRNFRMTKWPKFMKLLKENIDKLPEPEELQTRESFED
jgi:exonuclease III